MLYYVYIYINTYIPTPAKAGQGSTCKVRVLGFLCVCCDPPKQASCAKQAPGIRLRSPPRGLPKRCESALQNPQGALRAPPGAHRGPLGLWVLLRFRLVLAGHVVEISWNSRSLFWERSLFWKIPWSYIWISIFRNSKCSRDPPTQTLKFQVSTDLDIYKFRSQGTTPPTIEF